MNETKIQSVCVEQEQLDEALRIFDIAERDGVLSTYPKALRVVVHELMARAAAPEPLPVPIGWQLLPKEATYTMIVAGMMEANRHNFGDVMIASIYTHMRAAAPKPKEEKS